MTTFQDLSQDDETTANNMFAQLWHYDQFWSIFIL